ncbi:50S ribosomal protein L35 [bacterium]|nr:50S ribosomal protein L35 [bacterium]MBQ5492678.1 50S ribosomal protein L35 [Mycoplasmataceae bacterium]MBO6042001.1 50S ribosomal protein L35 [bacterium]MBO6072671.1 50S ribosomal protein L35 [bacterium]MBO6095534.1 50S ribosomal protein L35 [bacterium]
MAKIKMKTKQAFAKRFKETASGELKRKHAYRSHLAHKKSTKQKRHLRKDTLLDISDKRRSRQLLQK